MIITRMYVDGYKNLRDFCVEFDPKMNIICGENAQGKTNLIEAIWLCSGCRSFRGTRDKDFIGFDSESAIVKIAYSNAIRNQDISFSVRKGAVKDKYVALNGVKLPLLSKLFGHFRCVVFTPEDLNLTKGSPDNRRSFIDMSVSQIKNSYISALNKYNNILFQRNALLKNLSMGYGDESALDVWDVQLAKAGAYISVLRYTFCITLNNYTAELYNKITNGKEQLKLNYQSTIYDNLEGRIDYEGELADEYLEKLKGAVQNDIKAGYTTIGVHRDDLGAYINGLSVRDFGSQGQARSVALSMKLAHAKILKAEQGEYPVMLLDDVLSELDPHRQKFILNNIDDMQVILTCCDSKPIFAMKKGKVIRMRNGKAGA